jgi:CheY-like chemotaxis protein
MPTGGRLTIETSDIELDGDTARAHVEASPGPYVLLAVTDTGVGMDEATRALVFEPFFTTKGPGKGTGMGLATVYGIIKQSGGFIYVYSEPGQGATFRVYIPRSDASVAMARVTPDDVVPVAAGGETLLLVEDDPAVRSFVTRTLSAHDYRILGAATGAAAVAIASRTRGPIDLLVTDIVMPSVNGIELAAKLTAARPALRILFMSGFARDHTGHPDPVPEGAPFLPKPFSTAALLRAVRRSLDEPRASIPVGGPPGGTGRQPRMPGEGVPGEGDAGTERVGPDPIVSDTVADAGGTPLPARG